MSLGGYDVLCIVIIVQFLIFAFVLFAWKKNRRLGHVILAVFFLSKALSMIGHLVLRFNIANLGLYFGLIPFAYLFAPALYFYFLSLFDKGFAFKKKDLFHILPFFLSASYLAVVYSLRTAEDRALILHLNADHFYLQKIVYVAIMYLIIFGYIIGMFRAYRDRRKRLEEAYFTINQTRLRWLKFLLFAFAWIWICDIVDFVLRILSSSTLAMSSAVIVSLFLFANIAVFIGLKEPLVFNGEEEIAKYQRSKLNTTESKLYLDRLLTHMEDEKPHLDPNLTITKLGKRLSIPPRYLSQVINESLGTNYFDFVNGFRVEEAKRLLAERSNGKNNLLALLFDAGFNTKSAFNRAFKKHTGMTPSQFRRSQRSHSMELPSAASMTEDYPTA